MSPPWTDPRDRRAGQGARDPDLRVLAPLAVSLDGVIGVDPNALDYPLELVGGRLRVTGQPVWRITPIKTAAYLAQPGELVRCNPTGGGFTINLPSAKGLSGRSICVKNASASVNAITIDGYSSETIDGAATLVIAAARAARTLVSDDAGWLVV